MAFRCVVCEKRPSSGKTVSHAHKASNRWFRPNLQKIRVNWDGSVRRAYVCTQCIKSGKIQKAA
ncbi:MAG: 50S ribosomal protein L28 [Elusimicrobia bacterium]|nr:50S ribosomal protein L28 [Elusimicrobiota bacterium]MBI3012894.1 50S ribosomal protein L28 [Elusimicrobiota bacterium]